MPRHFTLREASTLLPDLREAVRKAIQRKAGYQQAEETFHETLRRITLAGGALVDRRQAAAVRGRRDTAAAEFKEAIDAIQEFGCLVKDLDIGLIDFPTLYRGEEVCLCWKLGEEAIRFWHGVSEGFAGRKPIDQEFLDHHEGDRPN